MFIGISIFLHKFVYRLPISMKYFKLKTLICLVIVLLAFSDANAQKKHFIFVQSENNEPFYIMINNKNYSSTLSGYLIIPRLKNGKYFFVTGFPKEKYPEQKFSYIINDKDVGFVLKQNGKSGWSLFNVVDFTNIMANAPDWETDKIKNDTIQIEDIYAINTSSKPSTHSSSEVIINSTTPTTENISPKPLAHVNKDTIKFQTNTVLSTNNSTNHTAKEVESTNTTNTQTSTSKNNISVNSEKKIIKTYQKNDINGIDEMYIDYTTNPSDTIIIFIPINAQEEIQDTQEKHNTDKINYSNSPKSKNSSNTISASNSTQYNTSCVYLATEADYLKTRKIMSYETSDDKMIKAAKKSFTNKCYYVEQIQKLGLLFISEQSRLKFFKEAYPNVYDKSNFASLEIQFTISSVINQFRQVK